MYKQEEHTFERTIEDLSSICFRYMYSCIVGRGYVFICIHNSWSSPYPRIIHRSSEGIRCKLADADKNEQDLADCGSDADIRGSGSTLFAEVAHKRVQPQRVEQRFSTTDVSWTPCGSEEMMEDPIHVEGKRKV